MPERGGSAGPDGFRLAVVMPVLDEAPRLAQSLRALAESISGLPDAVGAGDARGRSAAPAASIGSQADATIEVVVVDGGSRDDSVAIAHAAGVRVIRAERGRAHQMNAGAAALASGWSGLLFLHADTRMPPDWPERVRAALTAGADWGRFDVRLDDPHPLLHLVGAMMNLRSRLTGICTGDQAMFVSARAWARCGGFPSIPLMEDIAISKRLRACAGRPAALRAEVVVSARRWRKHGILRTILLMWELRLRFLLGASPQSLHRRYYGRQG